MVVNFKTRGISQGARKLVRTPTLNYKKKIGYLHSCNHLIQIFSVEYSIQKRTDIKFF
jgi:hypothetical protein